MLLWGLPFEVYSDRSPYDWSHDFIELTLIIGGNAFFREGEMKKNLMDLNRETAMRLWRKFFGKDTEAKDFAGRVIVKGAYNDRNSEYGWNVDHILPQSKGGVTADHNLVCCHISTNDEKADKFPCFTANDVKFEIIKVQNHYELKQVNLSKKQEVDNVEETDFFDSAYGIRLFKDLKGIQNKPRFFGVVLIRLKNVGNTAVIDFIEKFFERENISYSIEQSYGNSETRIVVKNYNMPLKENTSELLDKCVLLNTYFGHYFMPLEYISGFDIYFEEYYFKEKTEMYYESHKINLSEVYGSTKNSLFINNLVIINSEAKEKVEEHRYGGYTEYNYIYTQLAKNLDKEVSGK